MSKSKFAPVQESIWTYQLSLLHFKLYSTNVCCLFEVSFQWMSFPPLWGWGRSDVRGLVATMQEAVSATKNIILQDTMELSL